ncbi:pilus assembly protein PilP [Vibrio sp. AND4]|uniref:pilus assembly protein PilP n=1 Tax=Vibrio sp. AND4 TaxID=314289 RepID=UPI00015F0448|nr:pilus assembly protein PilP [Vibrio sp. AND4]EDP57926.1 putative fimbrial assembly protein PilP [Vibrio sp. AND4]
MPNKVFPMVCMMSLLVGCQANDESLSGFIHEAENQASPYVAKLQTTQVYVAMKYESETLRTPFELPREASIATHPLGRQDCWQPPSRKRTDKLEHFSIDQLRLKGVMGVGSDILGLVQAPNGQLYQVQPGQYLGRNNGKVAQVSHRYLLINETLPDGLGCWQQRKVKLALR